MPQYWLTWIGVFILYTISWLPFKWQLALGRAIGRLLYKIGGSRKRTAERNVELCFPEMSADERTAFVKENFENTGTALLETGMGWWWPDWRAKKHVKVIGLEHIEEAQSKGHGVMLLGIHNLSGEICCRGIGYSYPTVVFYRPHNNELMEYFQFRGRGRANKYMLGKRDVKGLISALEDGEACIYLPDQDYGRKRSLFVPFFNVQDTATTTGTLIFARQPNVQCYMTIPYRNEDNSGYTIEIKPVLDGFPEEDDETALTRLNKEVEQAVLAHPTQYMWLHRRFKTRPNKSDPSLYK